MKLEVRLMCLTGEVALREWCLTEWIQGILGKRRPRFNFMYLENF